MFMGVFEGTAGDVARVTCERNFNSEAREEFLDLRQESLLTQGKSRG
jgi:hypothetical protein